MEIYGFNPGDVIFSEGQESPCAYIIQSGSVDIFQSNSEGESHIALLAEGDIFGEMGLVSESPRSTSARANTAVRVQRISDVDFVKMMTEQPEACLGYLKVFFERLRAMNRRLGGQAAPEVPPAAPAPTSNNSSVSAVGPNDSAKTRARIRIMGGNPHTEQALNGREIHIDTFPFRVGRQSNNPFGHNELTILDAKPYNLSRNHFSIESQNGHFVVRDRGSYLGMVVNGHGIGGKQQNNSAELNPGENLIIAGSKQSPFKFRVILEK